VTVKFPFPSNVIVPDPLIVFVTFGDVDPSVSSITSRKKYFPFND
jgi:hypothetical protein